MDVDLVNKEEELEYTILEFQKIEHCRMISAREQVEVPDLQNYWH
jgi:hypothetical protein